MVQNDTQREQKYLKEISGTERNGDYGNHDKFFDKEQIMKLSILMRTSGRRCR